MAVQLTLQLQPGLTRRFKSLRAVTQWAVLNHRGGPAAIAAAVDMSPSEFGRKLSGDEKDPHRTLDVDDWEKTVAELVAAGDTSPLLYLIERFLPSDEQRRLAAIDLITTSLPQLLEAASALGAVPAKAGKR